MRVGSGWTGWLAALAACSLAGQALAAEERAPTSAAAILQAAGVAGGFVVHVGCEDGRLTAALRADERYLVHGLDRDAEQIDSARAHIRSVGRYGPVSVRQWIGSRLPYGDNLVNLLVISDADLVGVEELDRVLVPDGVALVHGTLPAGGPLRKATAGLPGWHKYVKPRPEAIDDWPHYLHDAGNNAVADDQRVGPPRHLQWKSDPMWCRSHEFASSVQTLVSAGGRLIGIIDEGIIGQPRGVPTFWTLIARDAFNGKLLWRRPCARIHPQALVASEDRIYVTLQSKGPLSILDAATGRTLRTCEATGRVHEIALCEGRLILCMEQQGDEAGLYVAAAAPDDGRLLWQHRIPAMAVNTLVAGDGVVCCCDGKELICLSLETGEERWRTEVKMRGKGYAVLYGGAVFLTGGSTRAFSLTTGKLLWAGPDGNPHARNPPGLFGAGGLIWCAWEHVDPRSFVWQHREETRDGRDPLTGAVRKSVRAERLVTAGHHIRCYPAKATSRYLLLNKRGVEFFDLEGSNHMRANWTRGACGFGMLPANGLLYTPPSQCFCYQGVLLTGMNALASRCEEPPADEPADSRRQQGPAYGLVAPADESAGDWPTYRHDVYRSGSTSASLPLELARVWETTLCAPAFERAQEAGQSTASQLRERPRGGLTPPVAAGGRVFVVDKDAHAVYALSAENGQRQWRFTADGRIDSPPTVYRGLCLFGSRDGHVYCLSAADGRLVWRFRAAPEERLVGVMDQLESAWPVHGSVLVRDGKVYCTAGRSSYLDGGIYLYALDPHTGQIVHETRLRSEEPDVTKYGGRPFDMEGARADILVAGPEDLYMLQNRFNPDLTRQEMPRITKLGDRQCEPHLMTTDGFLDPTWFNRTYWMYSARWPGYYFTYRAPKSGQILVFDDAHTYALKVYTERHGHSPEFRPGSGYQLIADRNTTAPVLDVMDIGAEKGRGFSRTELPIWSQRIPIRVQGMLLADAHLYVAGTPDLTSPWETYQAMIGKRGSVFRVIATSDGSTITEFPLEEVPVFDGLIAADQRLYMSTLDGTVICWGGK